MVRFSHTIHVYRFLSCVRIGTPPSTLAFRSSSPAAASASTSKSPSSRISFSQLFASSFRSSATSNSDWDEMDDPGEETSQIERDKPVSRDWLVDVLGLLALRYLERGEALLRKRTYRRVHMLRSAVSRTVEVSSEGHAEAAELKEARKMKAILTKSLKVDEELLKGSLRTIGRTLWFCESESRLYIGPVSEDGLGFSLDGPDLRCMDLADVSEIRPGKCSFDMDGPDSRPR